jgi:hypothetical protein
MTERSYRQHTRCHVRIGDATLIIMLANPINGWIIVHATMRRKNKSACLRVYPCNDGVNARRFLENKLDSNIECGRTRSSTVPRIEQLCMKFWTKQAYTRL